jgi:ABC-type transport system involved in cytochrome c biogenesis permease subunit
MAGVDDPHGGGAAAPAGTDADRAAATALLEKVADLAASARGLALVPPPVAASEQPEWYAIGDVLVAMQQGIPMDPEIAGFVTHLVAMQRTAHDPAAFLPEIRAFQATAERLARARGEYQKVDLEVTLNRLDPFHRAGHLYLLAFLAVAVGWMVRNPWPRRVAWGLVLATLALHVTGIVIRCILRERPPISTLYETVLFISAVVVTLCLVIEAIDRHAIALSVAPVLGAAGMYLAGSYEALKGEDTMPQLIAVLDTNFWLATHVTCIAIGYCGGLLAAFFALVGVVGRLVRRGSDDFYRVVHRFTYGILCFGLIFSVVGTILGGIWANDSWGRFWGWDPKENGALMICLAQLAILHGRLGGYLKPHGFAVATLAHGAVVAFSWWHVNYLGIGLHSYGFTKGVITTLWTVYGIVGAIVLAGIVDIAVRAGGGRSRAVT